MSRGCLTCGAHHADDAKFCRACGSALPGPAGATAAPPPPPACPACGQPNRPESRFCAQCGKALPAAGGLPRAALPPAIDVIPSAPWHGPQAAPAAHAPLAAAASRPPLLWLAAGGAAVVIAGGLLWWFGAMRGPESPTFDSAPPPSALEAGRAAPAAPAAPSAPTQTALPPSPPALPPAVVGDTPGPDGIINEVANPTGASPAPRRAESAAPRARATANAPPSPSPPAPPRTVQQRCGDRSLLLRSICESRACTRAQHANEPICQRIRAAEERRREQN